MSESPIDGGALLGAILPWYTGKARERVQQIWPQILASRDQGAWLPKVSRAARAALSKQSVAERFARANDRDPNDRRSHASGRLVDVCTDRDSPFRSEHRGWLLVHYMAFGQFWHARQALVTADALVPHVQGDDERAALAIARGWALDFSLLADLAWELDATQPRPAYVFGEISRAVLDNVGVAMGLSFETVRVPEIRWTKQLAERDGKTIWIWSGEILWPESCRHGASKFDVSASGARQCQACGHAIRRGDNWVPLVLDGIAGPASLWVGRDCARHLFGCTTSGEWTVSPSTRPAC